MRWNKKMPFKFIAGIFCVKVLKMDHQMRKPVIVRKLILKSVLKLIAEE